MNKEYFADDSRKKNGRNTHVGDIVEEHELHHRTGGDMEDFVFPDDDQSHVRRRYRD
jgi:hypothetical protein